MPELVSPRDRAGIQRGQAFSGQGLAERLGPVSHASVTGKSWPAWPLPALVRALILWPFQTSMTTMTGLERVPNVARIPTE